MQPCPPCLPVAAHTLVSRHQPPDACLPGLALQAARDLLARVGELGAAKLGAALTQYGVKVRGLWGGGTQSSRGEFVVVWLWQAPDPCMHMRGCGAPLG